MTFYPQKDQVLVEDLNPSSTRLTPLVSYSSPAIGNGIIILLHLRKHVPHINCPPLPSSKIQFYVIDGLSLKPDSHIIIFFFFNKFRFQNLSPKDKIACTAVQSSIFVQSFIKLLPNRRASRLFNLVEEKYVNAVAVGEEDPFFEQLLHQLRVAWLSESVIYFNSADLIDVRMLEWLNHVSNYKIFEYAQKGREAEQNLLWFNKSSYHYLQNWLANEFEKSIIINFFNKNLNYYPYEFKNWLSNHEKGNILGLEMTLIQTLSKSYHQIAIIKLKIKEQQDKFNDLRQLQLIEIVEIADLQKISTKRKNKKKRSNKMKNTPKLLQEDQQIQEKLDKNEISRIEQGLCCESAIIVQDSKVIISPTREQSDFNIKQQLKCQNSFQKQQLLKRKSSGSKNYIYVSPKRSHSPEHIRSLNMLIQGDIKQKYSECRDSWKNVEQSSDNNLSQELSTQVKVRLNKRKLRKNKKENQQYIEARKYIWNRLISRQLENMVDQLSMETNALYQIKILAFERVRVYIQSLYPMANAVLFGSNAIGLSLPNSDVDILLFGLPCTLRQQASDVLAQVAVEINAMGWVVSCSTYLNAKVPVVKLEIDPSIPFLQTKRKQDLHQVYNPMALYYLNTNNSPIGQTIKIDITINLAGVSSVGYQSTIMMKDWITQMPCLQRILILFKYILSIRGFNSNFNGGIGSYCLFTMIAAYLKNNQQTDQQDISKNFINILKWYGEEFDNLSYIVWLRDYGSCFVSVQSFSFQQGKKSLLKLIDPITGKLMNSSCNEYNNIKSQFRRILCELQEIQVKIEEQLKQNGIMQPQLSKMMQTKKGIEKWITKYQSKQGLIVKSIINRNT